MKSNLLRKVVIGTFLSVPAISSIISTIHLIDLFNLGNPTWLSILLAVTFELGSIASLLAISVIEKIKTGAIWFIFFILSALQILGNVYYSYSFTSDQILANPTFLTNFMDLFSFITGDEMKDVKIFLSCIIGIPIPLIALFFLKSNIDYLRPSTDVKTEPVPVQSELTQEADQSTKVDLNTRKEIEPHSESNEEIHDEHVIINPRTRKVKADKRTKNEEEKTDLIDKSIIEDVQETSNEPEDVIVRGKSNKKGRYIFDERGIKHYDS